MRILIVSIFLLFYSALFSQEKVSTSFVLIDDATKVELESCLLKITGNSVDKRINNYNSQDTIILNDISLDDRIFINASLRGYLPLKLEIDLSDFKREIKRGGLIEITLAFKYEGQSFVEVDVNATQKPLVVFSSDTISVSDFEIIDENNLILLTYPKRLEKSSEIVWFRNGEVKSRIESPYEALELISDYRKHIYLRCKERTYRVTTSKNLDLKEVNTPHLENQVLPILDTLEEDYVYFSNYNEWYPAFDYFMVTRTDTQYTKVRHLEDSEMMEQYRAEYKWSDVRTKLWAWDMEAESGIDREIWVGANVFTNSIYYEKPYSPMFLINEELILFDMYNDLLCRIDAYNCEVFDSIPIQFHHNRRKSNWEREILQDPISKKVYALYDHVGNTTLREINHETGELSTEISLFYRYTEHVTVYDNKIYYIYRPFESIQKKYLYVQDMDLVSGG
jgi:hypothetical protein